jgi:hypothetical protein
MGQEHDEEVGNEANDGGEMNQNFRRHLTAHLLRI